MLELSIRLTQKYYLHGMYIPRSALLLCTYSYKKSLSSEHHSMPMSRLQITIILQFFLLLFKTTIAVVELTAFDNALASISSLLTVMHLLRFFFSRGNLSKSFPAAK
eukprot:c21185_g1_i1 orf=549-869(-)